MSRYAGRHRDADPSVGMVPEVPAAPETLELSHTLPAVASPDFLTVPISHRE